MTVMLMWAIILLLAGLGLIILEAFLPSGGILGALAVVAVLLAVGLAFYSGPIHGVVVLIAAVVGSPMVVVLALKYWPHTPIGRRILLNTPSGEEMAPDNPKRRQLQSLVGKVGVARSPMLPSGAVEIEGRIIDAVSEGMPIDPGESVEVVEVHGTRVVVRPSEEEPTPQEEQQAQPKSDVLSKPIDSLGVDPFNDAVS